MRIHLGGPLFVYKYVGERYTRESIGAPRRRRPNYVCVLGRLPGDGERCVSRFAPREGKGFFFFR